MQAMGDLAVYGAAGMEMWPEWVQESMQGENQWQWV